VSVLQIWTGVAGERHQLVPVELIVATAILLQVSVLDRANPDFARHLSNLAGVDVETLLFDALDDALLGALLRFVQKGG